MYEIKEEQGDERKREHTDVICQQKYIEMFIKNRQQQGVNVLNSKRRFSSKEEASLRRWCRSAVGVNNFLLLAFNLWFFVRSEGGSKCNNAQWGHKEGSLDILRPSTTKIGIFSIELLPASASVICQVWKMKIAHEVIANYDTLAPITPLSTKWDAKRHIIDNIIASFYKELKLLAH